MSDRQAEIAAETQTLKNIADSLVEVNADLSVAKAVEKVKETQKQTTPRKTWICIVMLHRNLYLQKP